jgi:Mn-dependent DtxR family transcriptional regulator
MLDVHQQPGERSLNFYAELLGMSYSGAGKLMMEARRRGLIRRNGYKVHILTPQGEALMREATKPAAS